MKNVLFLLLIFSVLLKANDVELASSILNTIVSNITKKENPKIYIYKKDDFFELDYLKLNLVKDCQNSDVIILPTSKNLPDKCHNKVLFATKYSALKNKNIIGAFFWQKGRPNILFYKDRLNKQNIKLDASFDKYIEIE